jgi:Flp pilus assembly protein TadG
MIDRGRQRRSLARLIRRLWNPPRKLSDERGSVMVMVALSMVVLCGAVALGVDVGQIYATRGDIQNSADAASLAGALSLEDGHAAAEAKAREWAAKNDLTESEITAIEFDVTCSGVGKSGTVTVRVLRNVDLAFAPVIGVNDTDVAVCASAWLKTDAKISIYAYNTSCPTTIGVNWNGNVVEVDGSAHANGDMRFIGETIDINGHASYDCSGGVSGNTVTTDRGPYDRGFEDWPVYFERSDFTCTYNFNGNVNLAQTPQYNAGTRVLQPGVYCATGNLEISESASGNVTLVANGKIDLKGNSYDLDAYATVDGYDVLLWAGSTANDAIRFAGNSGDFSGIVFAPNGGIDISGNSYSFSNGGIFADRIKVQHNGTVAIYDSVVPWTIGARLIE